MAQSPLTVTSAFWARAIFPLQPPESLGLTGVCNSDQLIFVFSFFLVEMGFHHVAQASLELLGSNHLLTEASQSAGIRGVSHHAQGFSVKL